jgi:CheY-like chemotaxis protein
MTDNPSQSRTILLVEDDPADAHLVGLAFAENRTDTQMHHVFDGLEALNFLRRTGERFLNAPRPDLILLDLNMPRMDGREFLAALKDIPELTDIPVVILTTSDVERDVVASYQLGASGYLVKPVDIDDFVDSIRRLEDYWFSLSRLPPHRD